MPEGEGTPQPSFETGLSELEAVVKQLESGDLPLESNSLNEGASNEMEPAPSESTKGGGFPGPSVSACASLDHHEWLLTAKKQQTSADPQLGKVNFMIVICP